MLLIKVCLSNKGQMPVTQLYAPKLLVYVERYVYRSKTLTEFIPIKFLI